ncbi:hypothetical protein FIBSPDRAFT_967514 [Athelia psychrophila]|uniref:Uncharacterized protein n=1 Tax=Athelia psychrophila TaxID=1759441 RepID=A0A167VMJ6_9AGAM|nr:hypothetical protein FIBSPDRAFT_967514 [Fibularhizoctonia sp. CBS 109695]
MAIIYVTCDSCGSSILTTSSISVAACPLHASTREDVALTVYASAVVLTASCGTGCSVPRGKSWSSAARDKAITNLNVLPLAFPIEYAKLSFWWVASTANSHLFFRVRAGSASQFYNATIPCHSTSINYCGTWTPLPLLPNGAIFLNDTLICVFVSQRAYGNATFTSRGTAFWERAKQLCNSAGLFRISRALVTIGLQLASTTHIFLGLPYAELVGMDVAASSVLACQVFRMRLLYEMEGYDEGGDATGTMGSA